MKVDGIEVQVTNGDKVLFPRDGITKMDLIHYYSKIAPIMLPYLRGRPISMIRYPDGIDGYSFFQKEISPFFPTWIPRVTVEKKGGSIEQVLCEKEEDLIFLANLGCITPHIWLSRVDRLDRPDRMIIDLDPSVLDFEKVIDAALMLREEIDRAGLTPFVMTTGSRGMHVVIPLDGTSSYEEVRTYARHLAARVMKGREDEFTMEPSKGKRGRRLLLDILRNAYGQTGVAPYAVRAKDSAPVATPLGWEEVEARTIDPTKYNINNIFKRLEERGDPWKDIDSRVGRIPERANSA
jgi:bifunctional non-homologous end joining protein LigD